MRVDQFANIVEHLNSQASQAKFVELFGKHAGERLWQKHWIRTPCIISFSGNLEEYEDCKFSEFRPAMDKWIHDMISSAITPVGFKLVPVEDNIEPIVS
jgi:hypothetical protein